MASEFLAAFWDNIFFEITGLCLNKKVTLKWKELQKEHRRFILKLRHEQAGSQLCLSDNFPRMNSHDSMAGRKGQWHIRGFICHALDPWEPSKIKGFSTLFCPVLVLDDLFLVRTQNGFLKRHFWCPLPCSNYSNSLSSWLLSNFLLSYRRFTLFESLFWGCHPSCPLCL